MKFNEFELNKPILDAISELGFETATEIQQKAIPVLLNDKSGDLVGLAQTGTGKTAAFGLPLIQLSNPTSKIPETLILSPTRELCLQITSDLRTFAKNISGLNITAVYGGASIGEQIKNINRGSQIIVATPGRLVDIIRRKKIDIGKIKNLVLDEADSMLHMGFKEELDAILESTPDSKRTVLFSATMPPEVARIASTYMNTTVEISVGNRNSGSKNIKHRYCMVHSKDKYEALKRILDFNPDIYGIVFCRTKISTQHIASHLLADGYNAESLHGDLSQSARDQVMKKFRGKSVQVLVATDVAARGLDVDSLSHVIHYDLPDEPENYIHRSGRTGRAGRTGLSMAIINMKEKRKIKAIERKLQDQILYEPIPHGSEICEKQLIHMVDKVHSVQVDEDQIARFMPMIEEKLASLDRETLLKHLVSMEFNNFLTYYKDSKDINPKQSSSRDGSQRKSQKKDQKNQQRKSRRNEENTNRFSEDNSKNPSKGHSKGQSKGKKKTNIRINLGRKDKVLPIHLIGLIKQSTKNRDIFLGRIDIESRWTRIQVNQQDVNFILKNTNGFTYKGKRIVAEISP